MEFTEVQNIVGAFKALKDKPKADAPEEFAKLMADFTASLADSSVQDELIVSHAMASVSSGILRRLTHSRHLTKFDSLKAFDELRVTLHSTESEHRQREDELQCTKRTNMASTSTTSQNNELSEGSCPAAIA
ncbi:hypothetical protein CHS0354_011174 [Potamilus streckersoni]|uniref:Uncharacterized protein n=1 Tax=Potamilus streckersoni TaxID=2493646 RepID=A0AAE0S1L2_9BIVA|nr:hypothetical protein CHS0354_011174 [Potamilus streckersoni]